MRRDMKWRSGARSLWTQQLECMYEKGKGRAYSSEQLGVPSTLGARHVDVVSSVPLRGAVAVAAAARQPGRRSGKHSEQCNLFDGDWRAIAGGGVRYCSGSQPVRLRRPNPVEPLTRGASDSERVAMDFLLARVTCVCPLNPSWLPICQVWRYWGQAGGGATSLEDGRTVAGRAGRRATRRFGGGLCLPIADTGYSSVGL